MFSCSVLFWLFFSFYFFPVVLTVTSPLFALFESKGAKKKGYHRNSPVSAAASLLAYAVLFRIGAVTALHVVNNDRFVFLCRVCCCAMKRRKNLANARFELSHTESVDSSAAAALQQRLIAPAPEETDTEGNRGAAESSAAFALLRSSSIRELDLRTRTRTLRFKLPLDCFEGHEMTVVHPTTGETVAVTVPAGAVPGAFITVRYVSSEGEEEARPPPLTRSMSAPNSYGAMEPEGVTR